MSVPTNNPVAYTYTDPNAPPSTGSTSQSVPHPPSISKVQHHIGGILTTIYGLAELPPSSTDVTVLWLLHPRLQTQSCMSPFASHLITSWNKHSKPQPHKGLIAVSFDARNHGTREVLPIANEAWRSGNETHAQDMFSCIHGAALDTSLLLDYLPGYIFPNEERRIVQNVVMGISLGGHTAWQCVMADPRISAAIVTIGCPDYTRMMSDRARLSKRKTYTESKPPGVKFVGSRDFPPALVEAVKIHDPAGKIFGCFDEKRRGQEHLVEFAEITDEEKARLYPAMTKAFGNKRILNLYGKDDKLVPDTAGRPFLNWLGKVSGKGGWFEGAGLVFEDIGVADTGHEVPTEMVKHMERFMLETMKSETEMTASKRGRKDSRI